MPATHHWFVKDFVLQHLISGHKDLEVRLGHPNFQKVEVGDIIIFQTARVADFSARITRIARYASLEEALAVEDHRRVYPNVTRENLLLGLRQILQGDVHTLGVLVFEFVPVP